MFNKIKVKSIIVKNSIAQKELSVKPYLKYFYAGNTKKESLLNLFKDIMVLNNDYINFDKFKINMSETEQSVKIIAHLSSDNGVFSYLFGNSYFYEIHIDKS